MSEDLQTDHRGRAYRHPDIGFCPKCGSEDIEGIWVTQSEAKVDCNECGMEVSLNFKLSDEYGFVKDD